MNWKTGLMLAAVLMICSCGQTYYVNTNTNKLVSGKDPALAAVENECMEGARNLCSDCRFSVPAGSGAPPMDGGIGARDLAPDYNQGCNACIFQKLRDCMEAKGYKECNRGCQAQYSPASNF